MFAGGYSIGGYSYLKVGLLVKGVYFSLHLFLVSVKKGNSVEGEMAA